MNGVDHYDSGDSVLSVLLEGGPSDIPEGFRVSQALAGERRIKVPHRGGYEHFDRVDEEPDVAGAEAGPVVFRWTARTKVAE